MLGVAFFSQTSDLMQCLQSNKLKFRSDEGDSPLLRICPMSDHHKTLTHATSSAVHKTTTRHSQVSLLAETSLLLAVRQPVCAFICLSFASLQRLRLSCVGPGQQGQI